MKKKRILLSIISVFICLIITACSQAPVTPSEEEPAKACTDICPTCAKCMNASCKNANHTEKCQGHKSTQPILRTCTDICPTCGKCMNAECSDESHTSKCEGHEGEVAQSKHLIRDAAGNYGGTFNKSLYGEGAPLNGALDVENDDYYAVNDYFNVKSTDTRSIIPNFAVYQQTMQDTSSIALALSIFNHDGIVDRSELNEYNILRRYELLNNKTVYNNGVTPAGLVKMFDSYGYNATDMTGAIPSALADLGSFFKNCIDNDKYVLIGYQYGITYQWFLVMGFDDMGNTSANSDAVILANTFDASDHCQDGYTVQGMRRFGNWLCKRNKNGTNDASKECIVVDAKKTFDHSKDVIDPIKCITSVPERHLLFNADGTYGGTLDKNEYGGGNALNMGDVLDATEYNYFKFQDYYNMGDQGTRYLCSHYQAFIQSMASSCNICSILSILNYYQYDFSNIHNNKYILERNKKIAGSARHYAGGGQVFQPVADDDNGRKQEALVVIYMDRRTDYFDDLSHLFNNYGGVGASSLHNVPSALGYTDADTKYAAGSSYLKGGFGYYTQSTYKGESSMVFPTYASFAKWCKARISGHHPISTGWNPIGGHWTAIFGYDDMGTASIYDDVVIIADSSDCSDQYVDGYTTYPAQQFYAQWYNSSGSTNQMFVTFDN